MAEDSERVGALPWRYEQTGLYDLARILDKNGLWMALKVEPVMAERIITAVNAHDALVEVCRMATRLCDAVESAEFVGNGNKTAIITAKDLTILLVRYADCRAALQKAGVEA